MICPYKHICSKERITGHCLSDDDLIPLCSERLQIKKEKKEQWYSMKRMILENHDRHNPGRK